MTSTTNPFDALTKVHDAAVELDRCGDLLRLCVGVHIGELSPQELRGQSSHEDEYSRRVLWCLDRGYEYVEADLSEEGRAKGHDERDKEGYARIIEAVAGTVWSAAQMGKKKKQQLTKEQQGVRQQLEGGGGGGATEWTKPIESSIGTDLPENPFHIDPEEGQRVVTTTTRTDADKDSNGGNGDDAVGVGVNDADADSGNYGYLDKAETEEETTRRREEREQERMFDSLEGLMRQASRIREMSRGGELTDDQRRQRAGDAATLLMDLMTKLDLADGEDEDEGGYQDDSSVDEPKNEQEVSTYYGFPVTCTGANGPKRNFSLPNAKKASSDE